MRFFEFKHIVKEVEARIQHAEDVPTTPTSPMKQPDAPTNPDYPYVQN